MQSEFARQCINNAENAFTVDTVASTNAKTYFEASSDSIEASETNVSIVSTMHNLQRLTIDNYNECLSFNIFGAIMTRFHKGQHFIIITNN